MAVYLAQQRKIDKLILITPFDSIVSIAAEIYWYFPVRWLMRDTFDSASRAADISSQVLVLAAQNDEVIPLARTQNLIEHFSSKLVTIKVLANVGHNNIDFSPLFYDVLIDFLSESN